LIVFNSATSVSSDACHGMCAEAHPPLRAFASLMDLDARGRRGCVIGGDPVAGALERANRPCGDQAVTDQRHEIAWIRTRLQGAFLAIEGHTFSGERVLDAPA